MINYFELMRVLDGTPFRDEIVLDNKSQPWWAPSDETTEVVKITSTYLYQRDLYQMGLKMVGYIFEPSENRSKYKLNWSVKPNELEPENKFELVLS